MEYISSQLDSIHLKKSDLQDPNYVDDQDDNEKDEDVADEHRSNVLGQTWAKGERQGVVEAKEFLDEKVAEGIISDECSSKIMKLIDSLTTRR